MPRKGQFKVLPIIGEKHNKLTIIGFMGSRSNGKFVVECQCDCGKLIQTRFDSLRHGITTSCGCIRKLKITNEVYGDLTAIKYAGDDRLKRSLWLFRCTCGNEVIKNAAQVRAKNAQTHCGCKKQIIEVTAFNALYSSYKCSARDRGYEFSLTKEQFVDLCINNCFYCGQQPFVEIKNMKKKKSNVFYNGIDRVDNKIGYTTENCVSCCKFCNVGKASLTSEIFLNWIKKVYLHSVENKKYGK